MSAIYWVFCSTRAKSADFQHFSPPNPTSIAMEEVKKIPHVSVVAMCYENRCPGGKEKGVKSLQGCHRMGTRER